MATEVRTQDKIDCPMCGSETDHTSIERRGLTAKQLHIAERYIRDGNFGHMLSLMDSVFNGVDPGRLGPELEHQIAFGELQKGQTNLQAQLEEIAKKLAVPKQKGDVAEVFTIRDLKAMFPYDEFSEEKAAKGGTDIVGTVKENGREWGTIVVSVKSQATWQKSFLTQINKNMDQENTPYALLVTEKFPRDALNDKGYDKSNKPGEILWLVKPTDELFAYGCIRFALIAAEKAKAVLKGQEERIRAQEEIAKAVKEWINGEGLQRTLHRIAEAKGHNKAILDVFDSIKTHVVRQISNGKTELEEQMDDLVTAEEALKDLKKFLEGKGIGGVQK